MRSNRSSGKPKPEPLPQAVHEWSFEAIGTGWWIGLYESVGTDRLAAVQQAVAQRIEQFDLVYSRFRDDSLVSSIAREAGTFIFPADSEALFSLYRRLYDATNGAVTPLIGQALVDAGYDASYSLRPGKLKPTPAWDDVMQFKGRTLTTTQPILLAFGAAGKGYLVDLVAAELEAAGLKAYCVDASGDMVCSGLKTALKIGLEHPEDTSQVIGVADLQKGALCGSAGNRRRWAGYHHIIDPHALASPENIAAVWVCAETALIADGLTTALYFAEPETLARQFRFAYVIMYADGRVAASADFPAQLFTEGQNTHESPELY